MSKFTVSCVVAAASMMICAAAQAAGGMPSKIPHPIDAYRQGEGPADGYAGRPLGQGRKEG